MDHEHYTCSVRFLRIDRANCIADNRCFVESRTAATGMTQTAVSHHQRILATVDTREQQLTQQNLVKEKANKTERQKDEVEFSRPRRRNGPRGYLTVQRVQINIEFSRP